MANDTQLRILEWPAGPALLRHGFDADSAPLPVALQFGPSPVNVMLAAPPGQPLVVAMGMNLAARQPLPICIKLCDPICIDSDYTVAITLFDRPIISITIKGRTRLFNCGEEL